MPAAVREGDYSTLCLCALAALLEGFDTQSMGVAAPRVIAEYGLSTAQASAMFSATPLGLFLGAAVGGRVADLWGRKRALIASLLLFGLFSVLTAAVAGSASLMVVRLLTGLGLGGAMPNFISLASEATRGTRRLSVVTVIMAAMPFGGALAALVALSAPGDWGWRSIFYLGGTAPIVLAVFMMRFLRESRTASAAAGRTLSSDVGGLGDSLFGADRLPTTLMLWAGFFFTQMVLLLMLNWLPSLVHGLGFSRAQGSMASVCFNLGGSGGAYFLGRVHAGERRRRWVVITYAGMAAALATLAAIAAGNSFAVAAAACAFAGTFIVGAQLVLYALVPLYYPARIRGTGVGAAVALGRLGSVAGPAFAGTLLAFGGGSARVLLGIVPFVIVAGGAALALTWRRQSED